MPDIVLDNFKPLADGFTIFSKKDLDGLFVNPLFTAGKNGDEVAAEQLIKQIWTDDKTVQLETAMQGCENAVFFSVPGTSRKNKIPIVFAEFLAEKTGAPFLVGDEEIHAVHSAAMKHIAHGQRVFYPRLFVAKDESFFENFKDTIPNSSVILVEDTLTTGASSYAFARFLQKNGINVRKIFAIKGDSASFSPSKKGILKLQKMADKVGLDMDLIPLGMELTRVEVSNLAFQYLGNIYAKASDKQKDLIKEQLRYLYAIRVDGVSEKEKDLIDITTTINMLKGEQNEDVFRDGYKENCRAETKESGIQTIAVRPDENSTGTADRSESAPSIADEHNIDENRVRDNTESKSSLKTSIASQEIQSDEFGKTALLKKLLEKGYV